MINTIDATVNTVRHRDEWIHKAHLINQIVIIGCVITEISLEGKSESFDTLQNIEVLDSFSRLSNAGFSTIAEFSAHPENITPARCLEKLVGGFSDAFRPMAESGAAEFHRLSTLSNEELAKIPTSTPYDESYISETLTQKLCLQYESDDLCGAEICGLIKGLCDASAISKIFASPRHRHEELIRHREEAIELPEPPPQQPLDEPAIRQGLHTQLDHLMALIEQEENFSTDANSLPFIPSRFHNDAVFSQYICPITLHPIRDPLRDPISRQVYEKLALQLWVTSRGTAPHDPDRHLTLNELEERPFLKSQITRRLQLLLDREAQMRNSPSFQQVLATEKMQNA